MHILRLSCLETPLGFLKSTLTFKTSIYSLGYGDHTTKRIIFVSFVKKNINNLFKKEIDHYIQDTIQVFQIWHNLCFRIDEYVNF